MSDVFVSYKRDDMAAVSHLVEALRAEGLDVWWDLDIPPDAAWEQTIERQLSTARVVVVAWSSAAVASENVRAEARWARHRGRLLQVFLEACEPPLFFGERQGVDLKGWSGLASAPVFRTLVSAIRGSPPSAGRAPGVTDPSLAPPSLRTLAPASASQTFPNGTVLNGLFVVRRLVARGDIGELYEGANVTTEERVAIKTFRPDIAALPALREGLLREMHILTRLSHPAIVAHRLAAREPTYGAFYLVNEFIEGIPLDLLIGEVTAPEAKVRAVIRRLAEGLKHAHDLGVVHRELNPANIIAPGGRLDECKVVDFGISQDFDAALAATVDGRSRYAAPEQLCHPRGAAGPWTDVYSLGAVMLALATGRHPDAATAGDRVGHAPDLSEAPPGLRPLFIGMLAPNPDDRFRSMDAVLSGLQPPDASARTRPARRSPERS
jgi:eukaryotic-like serine/threonine-protein kinase